MYNIPSNDNVVFNFDVSGYVPPTSININFDFGQPDYKLLAGTSDNMVTIWADSNASRINGKMHVASQGDGAAFSVLDLSTRVLYDRYTLTQKGRANEALIQEDIKDLIAGT